MQPMPLPEELEEKFAELVEELDLSEANKLQMMSLPSAKKWQIYCSRKIPVESADSVDGNASSYHSNVEKTPTFYVDKLREITVQIKVPSDDSPKHNEMKSKIEQHTTLCDGLKTALRTSAHSFVLKFIEHQGLPALLNMLEAITDVFVANSSLHTSLIGCIKALMNNSVSLRKKIALKLFLIMQIVLHRRVVRMSYSTRRPSTSSPARSLATT